MQRIVTLVVALLGLFLVAAGLYLVLLGPVGSLNAVTVAPVRPGDQEVAWLHPATSRAVWERFVAGLREIPGIRVDDSAAFPDDSMKLPAVALTLPEHRGVLWIRWYKLTGQRTIDVWVRELCQRSPRPLAMVGGGNSERARDIAMNLARLHRSGTTPLPVFLITTATAEKVQHPQLGIVDLMQIYPQRTFRYCFTNRQMAEAISDFVRGPISQDGELQITSSRISLLSWRDDPFSQDLADQFEACWRQPSELTPHPSAWSYHIAHSVGGLNQPNQFEIAAVESLIRGAGSESFAVRGREMLVLPGGPAPARRLLRSLYHADPHERFFWVVTVGDAIDWNTLYRDRRLAWPIVDVPFPLIAFMHRNPVETHLNQGKGFVPEGLIGDPPHPSGTDDLLLYRDIGKSLVAAVFRNGRLIDHPDRLVESLQNETDPEGSPLFDDAGNRPDTGGEYLTLVRPVFEELRILPRSRVEVYARQAEAPGWRRVISLSGEYADGHAPANRGQP